MLHLRVTLFGRFEAEDGHGSSIAIESQKAQELFCYLLLFRGRPHARELLAETFWANNTTEKAKSYLRRTLWQLQNALNGQRETADTPFLLIDPEWLQLNPAAELRLDVAILENAYARAEDVPGPQLDAEMAHDLRAAVDLYQGSLLEGWYHNWCVFERERLQHIYFIALDKLISYCEAHGLYEMGIEYGLRALRQDQAREQTHRQLMRLRHLMRDRSGALRQYQWCRTALHEELEVEPTRRTKALYQRIKLGEQEASYALDKRNRSGSQSDLKSTINELRRIREKIRLLSAHVDDVILAAEKRQ